MVGLEGGERESRRKMVMRREENREREKVTEQQERAGGQLSEGENPQVRFYRAKVEKVRMLE